MGFSSGQVLSSFIWKFLEKCSIQVATFILTLILARILTPEEFGIIAIIIIFVNLANVIVEGGLTAALIQKKNVDSLDFSTIFTVSFIISFLIYSILYCLAPYIARFYNDNCLTSVLRILSIIVIPCSVNSIQKAYVSKYMLFKRMFIYSILSVILSGIIGIVLAYNNFGVWALVYQILLNQFLVTILMFIIIAWRPRFVFCKERFISLFDFGWKIFITNFIIAFYEDIRGLLIGKIYQPSSLAFFDRGKQFPSLIMGNINTSIQTVLFPTFSSEQENIYKVKAMMRTATQVSCFCSFPLLFYLMIAAEPLVKVLLTDKWLPCVPFIRIFAIAFVLMPLQSSNMIAIKALGFSNIILRLEIIKKIIEVVILIISFMYNVYCVALGVLFYNFICLFINLYPNKRLLHYSIKEQIIDILPIFAISITTCMVSSLFLLLPISNILILVFQFIVGAIIYIYSHHIYIYEL